MKIAFVVHGYGSTADEGPALHCRRVAERMAKYWPVEVLTTSDSAPGTSLVNDVVVRRFPVSRVSRHASFSGPMVGLGASTGDFELLCPQELISSELLWHLEKGAERYDFLFFLSVAAPGTVLGLQHVRDRAALIPAVTTPFRGLGRYRPILMAPRAVLFHTS